MPDYILKDIAELEDYLGKLRAVKESSTEEDVFLSDSTLSDIALIADRQLDLLTEGASPGQNHSG